MTTTFASSDRLPVLPPDEGVVVIGIGFSVAAVVAVVAVVGFVGFGAQSVLSRE